MRLSSSPFVQRWRSLLRLGSRAVRFRSGDGVSQLLDNVSTHVHEDAVTIDPRCCHIGTKATRRQQFPILRRDGKFGE
jgi:hypothetical protein